MKLEYVKPTKDQQLALLRISLRWDKSYRLLRRGLHKTSFLDNAVTVTPDHGNIWLLIETDGYTHS